MAKNTTKPPSHARPKHGTGGNVSLGATGQKAGAKANSAKAEEPDAGKSATGSDKPTHGHATPKQGDGGTPSNKG